MVQLAKTRALKADVSKYRKLDTGTANEPQKRSSKMVSNTRVESGGVASHQVKGTGAPSRAKGTMKKTRLVSSHARKM